MSDPLSFLADGLAKLDAAKLRRQRRIVEPLSNGRCQINGQVLWNFAANDYLGLAEDNRLTEAAAKAMRESGVGSRASPLVTGRTHWHARLEERLARFKRTEAAILFPTGFAANVGTITASVESQDVVFCDRLNHASLIDGCRLSRARLRVTPHADVAALERELNKARGARRRLIVTDSLFSMDGDAAPLAELLDLAVRTDSLLLIDEAHATGLFGEHGTGLLEDVLKSASVTAEAKRRVIAVGTLSKAIGVQGGFVTGGQELIDWLWNSARPQVFSTALSVPLCAAACASIDIIEAEPQRRSKLLEMSAHLRDQLRCQGWRIPENVIGPIIPVIIGEPQRTLDLAERLQAQGILVAGIRPPTVPAGTSRLRISVSFSHGDEGLAALLNAFGALHSLT